MLSPIFELKDLSFRYNPRAPFALKGVNLRLHAGEIFGLVGESGARGRRRSGAALQGHAQPLGSFSTGERRRRAFAGRNGGSGGKKPRWFFKARKPASPLALLWKKA